MSVSTTPSDQKELQAIVDRRHPDYECALPQWRFCEATYNGGREWFEREMHRYFKEGDQAFHDRRRRAYRFNHTREVTSLVTKYLFKEGIIRNTDDAPDCVQTFWKRSMLGGAPIDVLMRQVSDKSSINGRVWIVVDNNAPDETLTVADARAAKSMTYAYLVRQEDVLDFSRDDNGELLWILYRLYARDDEDPFSSSGNVLQQYMLWTRTSFYKLQDENIPVRGQGASVKSRRVVSIVETGENKLGEVPVIQVDHFDSGHPYNPPGLVDEIAYLDRAVANYLSNLDAIIQDQTFSQLIVPDSQMSNDEDASRDKLIELGTKAIFTYASDATRPPAYISPDASQATLIISAIQMIINEIYHSVGMAGERTKQDNSMGIDNSSGVAKAYDFDRMNALLCTKASQLDRAENALVRLVCAWNGETWDSLTEPDLVKYPDNYDTRGLPDEFDIAQNLALIEAPDALRRQQMQTLANKLFPRLGEKLKNEIAKEIKAWPPEPEPDPAMTLTQTANGHVTSKVTEKPGAPAAPAAGSAPGATQPASQVAGPKPRGASKQGQNTGS